MKSDPRPQPLKTLAEAYRQDLKVNPEYQRGTKWSLPQKQALIDSLLRGYEIPLFYVHLVERTNTLTGSSETTAWLVDGQQRLAAIADYLHGDFALPDPSKEQPGSVVPSMLKSPPAWHGKKFDELSQQYKEHLLGRTLQVIYMREEVPNEVRDLFIRLQAGTPLTAQEKRDAWPGDFTTFVIRHAGKANHKDSAPRQFFSILKGGKTKKLTVDDGDHYVDALADTRKFFAGLAMTIMERERTGTDFVDLKGKTINEFYKENLTLPPDDPAAARVLRALDAAAGLPGFSDLAHRPLSFQLAFHFALLVDSLASRDYVPHWRDDVVKAFQSFQDEVAKARQHFKDTKEELPYYSRFARLLGGSGSDTADVIRSRHAFFLDQLHPRIRITSRDPRRLFDSLAREVIWIRDGGKCQNPECRASVPFNDGHMHHIEEHTAGGRTEISNGILVCSPCHSNRAQMQSLKDTFQEHIRRAAVGHTSQSLVETPS